MTSSVDQFGRQLRLLVVDDDQLNQSMMQIMLSPHGYLLEFASDGGEALEAVKSRSYDLVFLDLVLPDMDGREVCRQIRAWEAGRKHLPIVALTAYDLPGEPRELAKAGMDDYLFKPYDLRQLSRIIGIYACGDEQESSDGSNGGDPAAKMRRAAAVLDYTGSLADFSNDVEGYQGLLRDFISGLPARLENMRQAQDAEDLERLGRECHSLKGVSAGLGALQLSAVAAQLGRCCSAGQIGLTAELLRQMEQSITDLQVEAAIFLKS